MYMGGSNQGARGNGEGAAGRAQAAKVRKASSKSSKSKSASLSVLSQSASSSSSSSSSMMLVQDDTTMGGVDENGGVTTVPAPIPRQSKKRDKILMERRIMGEGGGGEGGMMYAGEAADHRETGLFRHASGVATDKPPPQKKAKSNHGKALKIHLGDAINSANAAAAAAAAGGTMDYSYSTNPQLPHEGFPVHPRPDGLVDPSVKLAPARRRKRTSDKGQEALVSPYVQGMAMDGAGDTTTNPYPNPNPDPDSDLTLT